MTEKPPVPRVVHSNARKTTQELSGLLASFSEARVIPEARRRAEILEDWKNPDRLLEFRKELRDATKRAVHERADRVAHMAETGEVTNRGEEAYIALLAAIINYHQDEKIKELVDKYW